MTLSPADVRAASFRASRLRPGYDMDEVDEFLDLVQETIERLEGDVGRFREAETVLLTRCDELQERLASIERQPAPIREAMRAQGQARSLEDVRPRDEVRPQEPIRLPQQPVQRSGEVEVGLRARCAELQARIDGLERQVAFSGDSAAVIAIAQATADELVRAATQYAAAIRASAGSAVAP